ncbi:MAG TPA: hypothetical protein PKY82_19885 [Pyrinomonadaceae bacterium]|nr:hypothetical protein [Pyrinomonadaceae bacterium]
MKKWSGVSSRWSVSLYKASVLICVHLWLITPMFSQNKPCQLDEKTLQFVGNPIEQARCLLRPNKIGGNLAEELKKMPDPLEKLIGEKVKVKKEKLRQYLSKNKIDEQNLGGSLDEILSKAKLPNSEEIQALYFIIHDTSSPYLKDADSFPPDINDATYKGNNLENSLKNPVAHIFVNRVGESITTTPFAEAVRKGWGTKFARDILKADAKGLQIHIELIQPRRRDKSNPNPNNDLIAPAIGFTDGQYERLALLYICASVRRGTWLIPSYHSAMDAGIKDAHDDPQNFELKKFADKLKKLIKATD